MVDLTSHFGSLRRDESLVGRREDISCAADSELPV